MDGEQELFVIKKRKESGSQAWVRQTLATLVRSSLKSPLYRKI